MTQFTQETTRGYTDKMLQILNAEWDAIVTAEGLENESDAGQQVWKYRSEQLLTDFDMRPPIG